MTYKYETHLHTSYGSACAESTGAEMARAYKNAGFDGIIVTDHFFNGNSAISSYLEWNDRINEFVKGYEDAKNEGDKIGLKVFFGFEYNYKGTEFLVYGLGKEFLLKYPEMLSWSIKKFFEIIHENGGFIVHAHPFRDRWYIKKIRLYPDKVDAVEVINAGNPEEINLKAVEYAKLHNLPTTSGSDIHSHNGEFSCGIESDTELFSIYDYINLIKSKQGYRLLGK